MNLSPLWYRVDDYPDAAVPRMPHVPDWADDKDERRLCEAAWKLTAQTGRSDAPFLMAQLTIGYPKAARLSQWIEENLSA